MPPGRLPARPARSLVVVVLALAVLGASCGQDQPSLVVSPRVPPSASLSSPSGALLSFDGPGPADEALRRLCAPDGGGPPPGGTGKAPGKTPATIKELTGQVEQVRELDFERKIVAEPLTKAEIGREVRKEIEASLSGEWPEQRSAAWGTLGVIPEDTNLAKIYEELLAGQVIGFYVPETGRLVFVGSKNPSAFERLTLAHEMVHALDDQHFDLSRIDALSAKCRDEEYAGALAAVEGSAMLFSFDLAGRFFSTADAASMLGESFGADAGIPRGTPEFVTSELFFSYLEGLSFMSAMRGRGGLEQVDRALEEPPVSTEQILHPDRYPEDVPEELDISDLGAKAGKGWEDLDVMTVGESFLSRMLDLRLQPLEASDAAAGWDGGLYRAWSNGDQVVVALATVWDTDADAEAFAGALERYAEAGAGTEETTLVTREADRVHALFASDPEALAAFTAAAGPVD